MTDSRRVLWLWIGSLAVASATNAAEILAITPIGGTSHWNVMSSVLEVLLNRGHKVTVVSPFPRKIPHENYTEIDVSKLVPIAIASPWDTVSKQYYILHITVGRLMKPEPGRGC